MEREASRLGNLDMSKCGWRFQNNKDVVPKVFEGDVELMKWNGLGSDVN